MSLQALPYPPHPCLPFKSMSLNVERRKLWDYQRPYWSSDRCHRAGFTCQPFQSPHHRRPPDCSEEHLRTEMVFNASEIKLNNMLCFPMWVQNWGNWTSTCRHSPPYNNISVMKILPLSCRKAFSTLHQRDETRPQAVDSLSSPQKSLSSRK